MIVILKTVYQCIWGRLYYVIVKELGIILSEKKNTFYNNSIYYGDTESLYIEKNYWDVLNRAELVGEELYEGKNGYKTSGIFYELILAAKIKYSLALDEFGIIQEHKIFKSLNDSKRLQDRFEQFNLIEGKKTSALLPTSWKKIV